MVCLSIVNILITIYRIVFYQWTGMVWYRPSFKAQVINALKENKLADRLACLNTQLHNTWISVLKRVSITDVSLIDTSFTSSD